MDPLQSYGCVERVRCEKRNKDGFKNKMALNELAECVQHALEVTETGAGYDEIYKATLSIHSKRLRRAPAEPCLSKNHALQTLMTSRDECLPLADAIITMAKENHALFRGVLDVYLEWSKTAVIGEGPPMSVTFVPGRTPNATTWSRVCSVDFSSKRAWALFIALKHQWNRLQGAPEFYPIELEQPQLSQSSSSVSNPTSSASVSVPSDSASSVRRIIRADAALEPSATKPLPPSNILSWYDLSTAEDGDF